MDGHVEISLKDSLDNPPEHAVLCDGARQFVKLIAMAVKTSVCDEHGIGSDREGFSCPFRGQR